MVTVATVPTDLAQVERLISELERRINEAYVQVGRKGVAARAGIPTMQAEIDRLRASVAAGIISGVSPEAQAASLAGRTTPLAEPNIVEMAQAIQKEALGETLVAGVFAPAPVKEFLDIAPTLLNTSLISDRQMAGDTFPIGSPTLENPFAVAPFISSLLASSIGRTAIGTLAGTAVVAGASRFFNGNGAKKVRRGSNIITKRGMKQIRRIGKYRKQVSKAAQALGYSLKRRGAMARRVC